MYATDLTFDEWKTTSASEGEYGVSRDAGKGGGGHSLGVKSAKKE